MAMEKRNVVEKDRTPKQEYKKAVVLSGELDIFEENTEGSFDKTPNREKPDKDKISKSHIQADHE